MLATTKVKMNAVEKSEEDHIRHFLHKTSNKEVSESIT